MNDGFNSWPLHVLTILAIRSIQLALVPNPSHCIVSHDNDLIPLSRVLLIWTFPLLRFVLLSAVANPLSSSTFLLGLCLLFGQYQHTPQKSIRHVLSTSARPILMFTD